jgi:hypothetical protein
MATWPSDKYTVVLDTGDVPPDPTEFVTAETKVFVFGEVVLKSTVAITSTVNVFEELKLRVAEEVETEMLLPLPEVNGIILPLVSKLSTPAPT